MRDKIFIATYIVMCVGHNIEWIRHGSKIGLVSGLLGGVVILLRVTVPK